MAIAVDTAELVGSFLEAILYGLAIVLYAIAIYVLVIRRSSSRINFLLVGAATIMITLTTARVAVDLRRIFMSFVHRDDKGRITFLNDVTEPTYAAKNAIYITNAILGDAILIWRAYIIWERNLFVVIFPTVLSIGSAVAGYGSIYIVRHAIPGQPIFASQATKWVYGLLSTSLVANIIATALIGFRIWDTNRLHSSEDNSLWPIVLIVIESGAINAVYLLAYIVGIAVKTNGIRLISALATPIVSITFISVVVRVGMHVSDSSSPSTLSRATTHRTSAIARSAQPSALARRRRGEAHAMKPLQISVSRSVQSDNYSPNSAGVSAAYPSPAFSSLSTGKWEGGRSPTPSLRTGKIDTARWEAL